MQTESLVSTKLEHLLTWRNCFNRNRPSQFLGKIIVTEIGLALLGVVAVIEVVAYTVLMIASSLLICSKQAKRVMGFVAKRLPNSCFTLIWVATSVIANLFPIRIFSSMSEIKERLSGVSGRRKVDALAPMGIELQEKTGKTEIEKTAEFLANYILKPATPETIKEFEEQEASAYPYLVLHAIFIYAMGDLRTADLPRFFSEDLKENVKKLREELRESQPSQHVIKLFKDYLKDLTTYQQKFDRDDEVPAETHEEARKLYRKLTTVSSPAAQGECRELFDQQMWTMALNLLKPITVELGAQ